MTHIKRELPHLPRLKTYNEKEEPRGHCKVFCDSCFADRDDDELSQVTQLKSDDKKRLRLGIIPADPHLKAKAHLNNFTIQDDTPIYDSYQEESSIPVRNHDLVPDSQNLASSCEKKKVASNSQLCDNTICINTQSFLSHFHSFCTKSDCVLNFQTFDRLLWYTEHLIK